MSILRFKKVNCKNCYKCVRYCPVKAIEIKNHQAQIIEQECILCGNCTIVCPQNAKEDISNIPDIETLFQRGQKVVASVAPSYIAQYDVPHFAAFEEMLQKLGFYRAEETAAGAYVVKSQYEQLIEEGQHEVLISSCCPVVVQLIEKKYPQLLAQLAPVLSPMQTHAKLLKESDPDIAVVFIGPCISKKAELLDEENHVDYVITFDELDQWLHAKQDTLSFPAHPPAPSAAETAEEAKAAEFQPQLSRFFPVAGGILQTMRKKDGYDYLSIDDLEMCENAMQEISSGKYRHCFIEMSACRNSCVGGTSFQKRKPDPLAQLLAVRHQAIGQHESLCYEQDFNITQAVETQRTYHHQALHYDTPSEQQIIELLKKMGKNSEADELNCGTCGYDTCREKALAIFQNKAEINMCLPLMKERAESLSDHIVNASPNLMVAVDMDLDVVRINQTAMDVFGIKDPMDIIGFPISRIMDEFSFVEMIAEDKITAKKYPYLAEYDVYLAQDFIYDKTNGIIICIMKNITQEKNRKNKIMASKSATASMADKIVDEQLRIVHEIASLLGETAASTKVAVEELKNAILLDEEGEV